jgi:Flp pilus assembly pilin Flp
MLPAQLVRIRREERAQDLVEYTLIVAVIAVLSALLFAYNQESVDSVWTKGDGRLKQALSRI